METLSRAWKWKNWIVQQGQKQSIDLYNEELSKAPGKLRYEPGPTQFLAHQDKSHTKQVAGGWRAGKSKWLAAEILPYLFKDDARVWLVGTDYDLGREEFLYLEEWLKYLGAKIRVSKPIVGPHTLWITDWNAQLEVMTNAEEKRLEGANLDAVAIVEAGQVPKSTVDRLRGRVLEKGGPVLMAGSLEEALPWYINYFKEHRNGGENWRSFAIPSWENRAAFPGGRQDPKIQQAEQDLPEDLFLLKIASEAVTSRQTVFPEFDPAIHIVPIKFSDEKPKDKAMHRLVPYYFPMERLQNPEPDWDEYMINQVGWTLPSPCRIELAIDPGWKYAYAVLAIARFGEFVYVVDEVYLQRATAQDVIDECKTREWWPWIRGTSVIDIAGEQHHAEGESNYEQWRKNAGLHLRTKKVPIIDGINRLRTFLKDPGSQKTRIWIDPKCKGLRRELVAYKYRVDKEDRPERELPMDRDNHSIKALEYFLHYHYGWDYNKRGSYSESYIHRAALGDQGTLAGSNSGVYFHDDFGFPWERVRK